MSACCVAGPEVLRRISLSVALAILIAGVYVALNLMADVATILVSPRLRTSLR